MQHNIKGYIREIYIYLSYLTRQNKQPVKKFVIFGSPRSGSTLLVSLLNSHPMIFCEGEILLYRVLFPKLYLQCRSKLSNEEIYGFKFLTSHFRHQKIKDPDQFMLDLHQSGYLFISLKRLNILHATISLIYAISRGSYHHNRDEGDLKLPKININPVELLEKLNWMESLAQLQERISNKIPHLEIIYENNLLNSSCHQTTANLIADYLMTPRKSVSSDLVKIGANDISALINNSDELTDTLRTTPFVKYLDF